VPLTYYCAPGVGWAGWRIKHRTYYLTNDAAHDPVILPEVSERFGIRSSIGVPIVDSEKDVIAFLEVYNKRGIAGFTNADRDHSLAAAQIASLAIYNRLLYCNLRSGGQVPARLLRCSGPGRGAVALCRPAGFHRLGTPKPSPAFHGRRVAWVFSKQFGLFELLER